MARNLPLGRSGEPGLELVVAGDGPLPTRLGLLGQPAAGDPGVKVGGVLNPDGAKFQRSECRLAQSAPTGAGHVLAERLARSGAQCLVPCPEFTSRVKAREALDDQEAQPLELDALTHRSCVVEPRDGVA